MRGRVITGETPGMHHYEGAAGAERRVALAFANGHVHGFDVGEKGAELVSYHGWSAAGLTPAPTPYDT